MASYTKRNSTRISLGNSNDAFYKRTSSIQQSFGQSSAGHRPLNDSSDSSRYTSSLTRRRGFDEDNYDNGIFHTDKRNFSNERQRAKCYGEYHDRRNWDDCRADNALLESGFRPAYQFDYGTSGSMKEFSSGDRQHDYQLNSDYSQRSNFGPQEVGGEPNVLSSGTKRSIYGTVNDILYSLIGQKGLDVREDKRIPSLLDQSFRSSDFRGPHYEYSGRNLDNYDRKARPLTSGNIINGNTSGRRPFYKNTVNSDVKRPIATDAPVDDKDEVKKKRKRKNRYANDYEKQALKKPWLTDVMKDAVVKKIELLEQARKDNKPENWQAYVDQKKLCSDLNWTLREQYIKDHPERKHTLPNDDVKGEFVGNDIYIGVRTSELDLKMIATKVEDNSFSADNAEDGSNKTNKISGDPSAVNNDGVNWC